MLENLNINELKLNDIDPEMLADILDFIYKNRIEKFEEKIEKLLVESEKVRMDKRL